MVAVHRPYPPEEAKIKSKSMGVPPRAQATAHRRVRRSSKRSTGVCGPSRRTRTARQLDSSTAMILNDIKCMICRQLILKLISCPVSGLVGFPIRFGGVSYTLCSQHSASTLTPAPQRDSSECGGLRYVSCTLGTYLMTKAISGHHWSSEAIRILMYHDVS